MKIDIHTHIMPEHIPNWAQKFGYGEFIHLEHRNCNACMMKGDKLFRVVEENCFRKDIRLKEMDETDVTIQVLSTIPVCLIIGPVLPTAWKLRDFSTTILPKL